MITKSRNLVLDVFNYNNQKLCTLYDNSSDLSGQAYDVFVETDRNGWRELSFNIPSTINTPEGIEPNYRLDYIQPDYRIRLIDDDGVDWFLITEPSYSHHGNKKDVDIKAGHIAQLLKTKNLGLVFSDTEGNNVGTAEELLTTILDGTDWNVGSVAAFKEKDGTIKKRSLKANAKTGAFKLISNMCDLFEAKPIYHGDTRTVDIVPLNPFTVSDESGLPDVTEADRVVELAYSKNLSNVTRSMNTENMVTKLYAYGSYGDQTNGYCGIDECTHIEHVFELSEALSANETYCFTVTDESGTELRRSFTVDRNIPAGSKVILSMLDPTSMSYVWIEAPDDTTFGDVLNDYWNDVPENVKTLLQQKCSIRGHAYLVQQELLGTELPYSSYKESTAKNWFSYLVDFTYYQEVNLLTDDGLQKLAGFQRFAAAFYNIVYQSATQYNEDRMDLSQTIGDIDFCRLNVSTASRLTGGDLRLTLDMNTEFGDGILYRSDYDVDKKKHFLWTPTAEIKENGDPKTAGASMLFVIYKATVDGKTVTRWEKGYLKAINKKENPDLLTFHMKPSAALVNAWNSGNADVNYFLFGSNNINGLLGALEIQNESNITAINNKTKVVTVEHPLAFGTKVPVYSDAGPGEELAPTPKWFKDNGYAWFWRYDETGEKDSKLFFCYYKHFSSTYDKAYQPVIYKRSTPTDEERQEALSEPRAVNPYWFDWDASVLYRWSDSKWNKLSSAQEQKVVEMFGAVYAAGQKFDKLFKGEREYYTYTVGSTALQAGNYVMRNPYGDRFVFSTDDALYSGDKLVYNAKNAWIEQIMNGKMTPVSDSLTMEAGTIKKNGKLVDDTTKCRSENYITATPGQVYSFSGLSAAYPLRVYKYNKDGDTYTLLEVEEGLSGYDGTFTASVSEISTPVNRIKLGCDLSYQIFNKKTSFQILKGSKEIIECKAYRPDQFTYHKSNIFSRTLESGYINAANGSLMDGDHSCRSASYIRVYPNTKYVITNNSFTEGSKTYNLGLRIHYYDYEKNWLGRSDIVKGEGVTFTTPAKAYYIKVVSMDGQSISDFCTPAYDIGTSTWLAKFRSLETDLRIRAEGFSTDRIIDDELYTDLTPCRGSGEIRGIQYQTQKFKDLANQTFLDSYKDVKAAQDTLDGLQLSLVTSLGDMYREGYWQKNDYVDGDEDKLYEDALESLKKIARPKATYNITYLDLYGTDTDPEYGASGVTTKALWPDLSINSAVHLVDPEIAVNCWAYMDKIKKCYDQPWKTSIDINTELTTIAQHSFADVMSNIADVASAVKSKEAMIDRAASFSKTGTLAGSNLEGVIDATKLQITGGASMWKTNENGNMIFESVDGNSAMTLTGAGFAIANSKDRYGNWNWRTLGDGNGLVADEVTTGKLRAGVVVSALENNYIQITDDSFVIKSEGSFIVDSPNFSIDENGNVSIERAVMSEASIDGEFTVNGYPVLSNYDIYVGTVAPDPDQRHEGLIWIQTSDGVSNGSTKFTQTVSTATAFSSWNTAKSLSTGTVMARTANDKNYTYTLTIPYNVSATGCSTRKLTARINSNEGSLYFANGKALSTTKGNQKLTLKLTSTVCLSGAKPTLSMELTSSAAKPYDYFKVNGNITLQCVANRETGNNTWHTATVKYFL